MWSGFVVEEWIGDEELRTTKGTTVVWICTNGFGVNSVPPGFQINGMGEGLG